MKDNIVARVAVLLIIMLAILVSVATVAIGNVKRSIATSDWVNHTHAIIIKGDALLSSLHAGDAALRTYLITFDARDQAAYREAYTEMTEALSVLDALTRNEPKPKRKVEDLKLLVTKHVEIARDLARSRQQQAGSDEALKKVLQSDAGGESMRRVRKAVTVLQDEQNLLLAERDKDSYAEAQTTRWTVISGLVVNFVLLVFSAFLVNDDISARKLAANALSQANAQLEIKVQERTAELAASNQNLIAENLERQWGNKSLEHQLRYSNLIINSINDLVFVLTKSLNVTRINPAVAHLTRLDPKDLITSPLSRFVRVAQDSNGGREILAQSLRDGRELQDVSVQLIDKDGKAFPYRMNLVPLRDRDKVVGGVVTLRSAAAPQTV